MIGVLMWHKMQLGSAFRVKLAFTIFLASWTFKSGRAVLVC